MLLAFSFSCAVTSLLRLLETGFALRQHQRLVVRDSLSKLVSQLNLSEPAMILERLAHQLHLDSFTSLLLLLRGASRL